MALIAVLVLAAGFGAWFSARHRPAVPAALVAVVATLLTVSTPVGSWAPQVVMGKAETSSTTAGPVPTAQVRR